MRALISDNEYFKFLDQLKAEERVSTTLAPIKLMEHFPTLRAEEARAVCQDWRNRVKSARPSKNQD